MGNIRTHFARFVLACAMLASSAVVMAQTLMPTEPNGQRGSSNQSSTTALPGATLQSGSTLLVKEYAGAGSETRSLTCEQFYNGPTPGVVYGGGPVTQIRTQTDTGWSDWSVATTSLPCTRTFTQKQTNATCPAGQSGAVTQERIYTLNDAGVTTSDTGWVVIASTCEYYNTGAQTETQTVACPSGESGSIIYARTYDLWSDNSKRNYSAWGVQSNTCASQQASLGYNFRALSCPSGQEGAIMQQQPYSIDSMGAQSNFGAWATISSTCKSYEDQRLTQYETRSDCPSNMIGSNTYARDYTLWTDGSTTNYTDWRLVSSSCTYYDTGALGFNYHSGADCPAGQLGVVNYYNVSNIWSDGSWRNTSGWISNGNTCYTPNYIIGSWTSQRNFDCSAWGNYGELIDACGYYSWFGNVTYCQNYDSWLSGAQTPSGGEYQCGGGCILVAPNCSGGGD